MSKKPEFTVQIKHDYATVAFRFQSHDEKPGQLQWPDEGETDAGRSGQLDNIPMDRARAGRYVQWVDDRRRAFALSRIDTNTLQQAAPDEWLSLEELHDGGFRYLVLPEIAPAPVVARVQLKPAAAPAGAPAGKAAVAAATASLLDRARGRGPDLSEAKTLSDARTLPPSAVTPLDEGTKPVPMDRELAAKTLARLDRDEAVARLEYAMEQIQGLHQRVEALQQQLAASAARERDLIEVLSRWQERATSRS